jgi:GNAT superfamily N-acetyltransferase
LPLSITTKTHLTPQDFQVIQDLEAAIFPNSPSLRSHSYTAKAPIFAYTLTLAQEQDQAIGFKLGFSKDPTTFYSWIGGVIPSQRKKGIAKKLMQAQHQHLKDLGYSKVQTTCRNKFPHMLILNIQSGFQITGTVFQPQENDLSIHLEKKL